MEALYDAESFGSVRIAQCNMSHFIPPVVQAAAACKLSWAYPPPTKHWPADVAPRRHRRRPPMKELGVSIRDGSYLTTEHRHAYVAFGQVVVVLCNRSESETEQAGLRIRFALSEVSRPGTRRCSMRDDS